MRNNCGTDKNGKYGILVARQNSKTKSEEAKSGC